MHRRFNCVEMRFGNLLKSDCVCVRRHNTHSPFITDDTCHSTKRTNKKKNMQFIVRIEQNLVYVGVSAHFSDSAQTGSVLPAPQVKVNKNRNK